MLDRAYSSMRAYTQSKLAQVMLTFDLAAELRDSGVTVNCLHPATYMDTAMVRAAGVEPASTVAEGAAAVMHLAVSTELEGQTGEYFDGLRPARASAQAYDAGPPAAGGSQRPAHRPGWPNRCDIGTGTLPRRRRWRTLSTKTTLFCSTRAGPGRSPDPAPHSY